MRQLAGIALVIAALFVLPKMDGGGGGTIDPDGTADIAEQVLRTRAAILRDTYTEVRRKVLAEEFKHPMDVAAALEAGVAEADKTSAPLAADAKEHLPEKDLSDPAAVALWLESAAEGFGRVAQ